MGVIDEDFGRLAYDLIVVELGIGGYLSGRVDLVGRGGLGLGLDLQEEEAQGELTRLVGVKTEWRAGK